MMSTDRDQRPQILIVDHDVESRETLADVLEVVGYRAACVGDGGEALEQMKDGTPPSLVVLDPEPDGAEVVPFWRDHRLYDIPLVILTSQEDDDREAVHVDAAAHFKKPVDIPALLSAIESHRSRLLVEPG